MPNLRFLTMAWIAAVSGLLSGLPAYAQPSYRLREALPVGYRYQVSSRSELDGKLLLPPMEKDGKPQSLAVSGKSTVEYAERILAAAKGEEGPRTLRVYQTLEFRRKAGDQTQESQLRAVARRMVLLRLKNAEVPFSPDAPLLWSEIDMVRTDVFTPTLIGLLPEKEVRVGDRWEASKSAIAELTDLEESAEGRLECKLADIVKQEGRTYAQVSFKGEIRGVNADGPNKQALDGYLYFDLQSEHISYVSLRGVSWLLDKDGKELGKLEGQFVLTRRLAPQAKELSDDVVKGLAVEPTAENTLLLFDESSTGVRFLYPRRWSVRRADGRQIALDEPGGGGLLVTLEPLNKVPTAHQFAGEVDVWLKKKDAKVQRGDPTKRLQKLPEEVDRFSVEVEIERENLYLDYYIVRQAAGGATVAGRYPAKAAKDLQPEAEAIIKSLRLVPPKK